MGRFDIEEEVCDATTGLLRGVKEMFFQGVMDERDKGST